METPHEYKERPGACSACGNSPVSHPTSFVFNSLNVVFSILSYRFRNARLLGLAERGARRVMEYMDFGHAELFARVGLVHFGEDPTKARTYRSQVVWEEAQRRGIVMQQVIIGSAATDLYRARVRGAWQYFKSIPVPPELDQNSYLWIDDKHTLKRALAQACIGAPRSRSVYTLKQAEAAFIELGGPVVVKPRTGSRGRHTTTAVSDIRSLRAAFRSAQQLCFFVSIEDYLRGPVCRGTVIGGSLAGFFCATPPQVIGDGVKSIAQLIAERNAALPERVQPILLTEEHHAHLSRQGMTTESRPDAGSTVPLTHRTGRLFGGETRELLGTVHPALRAQLESAAKALNVPVVGFDLIVEEPERDLSGQRWGIIEANSLPFIDLHYLPLYGEPSNPAKQVWDLWK